MQCGTHCTDLANWMAKAELVANQDSSHINIDPHREAYAMYSHVSRRGSCLCQPAPEVSVSLATYDSTVEVPTCDDAVESCSSGEWLDGRAGLGPASEATVPTLSASVRTVLLDRITWTN